MNKIIKKSISVFLSVLIILISVPFTGLIALAADLGIPGAFGEYTVTFYLYQKNSKNVYQETKQKTYYDNGESIVFVPTITETEYDFVGWVDSTGKIVNPENMIVHSDMSFYALFDGWNGTCGDNINWYFNGFARCLLISGSGSMDNFSSTNAPWYAFCNLIKSVDIVGDINNIGDYAFAYSEISSITIPDSVTKIGESAFNDCKSLYSIELPKNLIEIGSQAFFYTNLKFITIPNKVSSIGAQAFYSWNLSKIIVSSKNKTFSSDENGVLFNKEKTQLIRFPINCAITEYIIPNSVTSINSAAFDSCSNIVKIIIPASVNNIGTYAFSHCTKLKNINIPEGVKTIPSYTFHYCTSLESIEIPISLSSIKTYAFKNCGKLKNIFYNGTLNKFMSIFVWGNNDEFRNATKHYNSANVSNLGYRYGVPTLTKDEAKAFLEFLYNGDKRLDSIDLTQDVQYKLLTGDLFLEDLSPSDIKNIISAFGLIVEAKINGYVDTFEYSSEFISKNIIKRLENEYIGELEVTGAKITDSVLDFLSDEIADALSINVNVSVLSSAAHQLVGMDSAAAAPGKLADFCKTINLAIQGIALINNYDRLGRYGYFNAYLNAREGSSSGWFDAVLESAFIDLVDKTYYGINGTTRFTDNKSWVDQRSDIEKWAEYFYQLSQYQYKEMHSYQKTIVEPSCTEQGYTEYSCIYCDDSYKDNYIEPTAHNYVKSIIKPTCLKDGYTYYRCQKCSHTYITDTVPATGHIKYTVKSVKSTCIQGGYDLYTCACGVKWKDNITEATGHSYISTVVEPTETEQGYTINNCSACGTGFYSNYTNPTGHEFITTIVAPTCESEGYTTHLCGGCGYEYTDNYVPANGHTYSLVSETLATCTEEGTKEYSCVNCEISYTETVSVTEHNYDYSTEIIEPTCDEQGYTVHTCVCGETYSDTFVDALGHNYAVIETIEASCTENGHIKYECSICGVLYYEIIYAPESGHIFEVTETVAGDCTHCGYTLTNCTLCGVGKYENLVFAEGHILGGWQETIPATQESDGEKERYCNNCEYFETGLIQKLPANGQKIITIDYFLRLIFNRIFELIRNIF